MLPEVLTEEQFAWAMRKGDDALASVNQFFDQSREDSVLLKVFRRWTAVRN